MSATTCRFCSTDINASDPTHCGTRNEALNCPWFTEDARKEYLRSLERERMASDLTAIPRRRIFAQARSMSASQHHGRPNWVFAKDLFVVGSTYARALCEEMGIDPDAYTASPWPDDDPSVLP